MGTYLIGGYTSCTLAKSDFFSSKALYSSPHVYSICERLRFNGVPVEEALFAKYFAHIWEQKGVRVCVVFRRAAFNLTGLSPFLQTLMPDYVAITASTIFYACVSEQVDALVLETGLGGAYDPSNVFPAPLATGITLLELEHTELLGSDITEIAWHKGNIMKVRRQRWM